MRRTTIIVHPDVEKFINSLDKPTFSKVLRSLDLLENFGYRLEMPHSKKIILLHGFIKKKQKIPAKEIKKAQIKLELI